MLSKAIRMKSPVVSAMSLGFPTMGAVLLGLILQIPSLRAVFKLLPYPAYAGALLIVLGILFSYLLLSGRVKLITDVLSFRLLPHSILVILSVINWFVYPIIDGRKAQGLGSTGDDAMIEPIRSLLAGGGLYDARLYDGAPISPGPGWILLNAPLTISGLYFLITPVYLTLTVLLFRSWVMDKVRAATAMALILSSPIIWELMTNGHDLVALGCSLALLPLLCFRFSDHMNAKLVMLALLVGLVATARIVLLPLPLLLAAFLWKKNRAAAMLIGGLGLTTAVGLHTIFYMLSDPYSPLHLLGRGRSNVGFPLIAGGAVATLGLGLAALVMYKPKFESMFFWYGLCLLLPFSVIPFGEFQAVGWNIARWEGANYLVPAIPSIVFSLCLSLSKRAQHTLE